MNDKILQAILSYADDLYLDTFRLMGMTNQYQNIQYRLIEMSQSTCSEEQQPLAALSKHVENDIQRQFEKIKERLQYIENAQWGIS